MDIEAEFARIAGQRKLEPEEADELLDWLADMESMFSHATPQSNLQAEESFDARGAQ